VPPPSAGTPRVSVIIPCFNLGAYLDEAVASVLAQTYQDFEILIVDDGSTEKATRTLLSTLERPKTRVLSLPHGGLAAARNAGVESSSGAYVCALDADDCLEPSYLAKTVRILDEDPSVAFASAWLRSFGEEESEWKPERCDIPTLLWEDTVLTAAVVRREAVLAVGGFDTAMPVQGDEDWDLWLTLAERGYRGVIIPEVLFNYRRRAGSMSTVCWHGPGHLPLASYRVAKHRETYRAHLVDVLLHQDAEIAAMLKRNDQLERYLATELEPAVALRRQELDGLRTRAAAGTADLKVRTSPDTPTEQRITELEQALSAAADEVRALRTSKSWRITRPLRAVHGWWLARRGSLH
jgi:glycosyltransferase involved in cell wall biosynthesis